MNPTYTTAHRLIYDALKARTLTRGCLPSLIGHLFSPPDLVLITAAFDAIALDAFGTRLYPDEAWYMARDGAEKAMLVIAQCVEEVEYETI